MRNQTIRTLAAAAVVAALAGGGATLENTATARALTMNLRTLHLVERGGGIQFVDNLPKAKRPYEFSPGDIVIVVRDIYTRQGARAGSLRIVCVATDRTTQQCGGTETLTGGTLELSGLSSPAASTTVAVIGGTGLYNGARGTSRSIDRKTNTDIADQTIALQL